MKKIIVPTDFSATAATALDYALQLAAKWGETSITVVHCFMPLAQEPLTNPTETLSEILEKRQQALQRFTHKDPSGGGVATAPKVTLSSELLVGFPAEQLIALSQTADYLILSSSTPNDVLKKLLGSISIQLLQRAHCPVILIPPGWTYRPLRHVAYAANSQAIDPGLIHQLLDFVKSFDAQLQLVHLDDHSTFYNELLELSDNLQEAGTGIPPFSIKYLPAAANIGDALGAYATEEGLDLLVMGRKQYSFWEQWFHPSATHAAALAARLPLMVLHA